MPSIEVWRGANNDVLYYRVGNSMVSQYGTESNWMISQQEEHPDWWEYVGKIDVLSSVQSPLDSPGPVL